MKRLRQVMAAQVAAIRRHGAAVTPNRNPEELHQLRVAVRRLRAFLRVGRPLIRDDRLDPLRAELHELGDVLAPARDLDVFLAYLRDEAATLDGDARALDGILARVDAERRHAYAAARRTLDSRAHADLLDALDAFCSSAEIAKTSLDDVVAREVRRFRKAATSAETDEGLHAARIHAKRARYAAEVAGDRKVAGRMKRLQDAAGEHQDAVVAETRLRSLADEDSLLVLGRLVERQAVRRRRAREAWAKLV